MTRARGIDERGNSCELNAALPAGALAEILVAGGWKYAVIDSDGESAGTVALRAQELRRTYIPAPASGNR